jgi:hypothetical protein
MSPGKLIADTDFFIDHAVPDRALERVVHGMNQQVPQPWEWLFGHLEQGCEYVCILEYSFDPEYKMIPVLHDEATISNGTQPSDDASNPAIKSLRVAFGSRPAEQTSSSIRYAEIDRYLLEVPESCNLNPKLSNRAHASLFGSMRKLIFEARELIANTFMLATIMGAKQIPDDLRKGYQSANLPFPLPDRVRTWIQFTGYAYGIFEQDTNVAARMLILQAIHFQELRDNHEKSQRERVKKDSELVKERRIREKDLSAKSAKQEPASTLAVDFCQNKDETLPAKPKRRPRLTPITSPRTPLAPKPQKPSGTVEIIAKTPVSAPKPRSSPMLSSIGNSFRRLRVSNPQRSLSDAQPRGSIPMTKASNNMPATPEQTPPRRHSFKSTVRATSRRISATSNAPVSTSFVRPIQTKAYAATTPPATPPPPKPQPSLPHYMAPTVGSMQRYKTHSPQLFYSDDSDGESRSNVSGRPFLKNSGKILDRTQRK